MSTLQGKKEKRNDSLDNVASVMKQILPTDFIIDDAALSIMKQCVVDFISSVGCEAASKAVHDGNRTVSAHDILSSLHNIGFDDYTEPMNIYIHKTCATPVVPALVVSTQIESSKPKKVKQEKGNVRGKYNKQPVFLPTQTTATQPGAPFVGTNTSTNVSSFHGNVEALSARGPAVSSSSSSSSSTAVNPLSTLPRLNTVPLSDPKIVHRLQQAVHIALANPTADMQLLASQVPISYGVFTEMLRRAAATSRPSATAAPTTDSSTVQASNAPTAAPPAPTPPGSG